MQTKIVLRLLALAVCIACVGCKTGDYLKFPPCEDAITLVQERKKDLLTNGRPKVVSYFSDVDVLQRMLSCGELDINLLKRQINENREFDFLIFVGGNDDDRTVLEDFVYTNKLNVLLFIDRNGNFAKANCMDGIACVSLITDPDLRQCDVAIAGARLSPFDEVMSKVRRGWGW